MCLGIACFQATFLTLAGLCAAGAASTVYLSWRLRGLYNEEGRVVRYAAFIAAYGGSPLAAWLVGGTVVKGAGGVGRSEDDGGDEVWVWEKR